MWVLEIVLVVLFSFKGQAYFKGCTMLKPLKVFSILFLLFVAKYLKGFRAVINLKFLGLGNGITT